MKPLLVIGDALLDRDLEGRVQRSCPDAPAPVLDEQALASRPGGAGLAAAMAAHDGREVALITALGEDAAGHELGRLLARSGVEVLDLGLTGATPEKIRVRERSRTLMRIDRGEAGARNGALSAAARAAIGWAETILVSDYGRGLTADTAVRGALQAAALVKTVVWDPHPRGAPPVRGVTLASPNLAEASGFVAGIAATADVPCAVPALRRAASLGTRLAAHWDARSVCVTCAADGAVLCCGEGARRIPAEAVANADPCGAGDRFAATAAGALADGIAPLSAARAGVLSASEFVASGGAAEWAAPALGRQWLSSPSPSCAGEGRALAAAVHRQGGTVVATGGCFDLLHAGHISTLRAAREMGDCLIVCLNSDASVARLKGPTRPLVGERDRARVLAALGCVDAVMIFDEDTPHAAITELRPDVWVKGGDYGERELPERATVEECGGHVATVRYLDGHSTSGLLEEVVCRGGS